MIWRVILRKYHRGERAGFGKDLFSKPTVIIGNGSDARALFNKMMSLKSLDYDLKGWISVAELNDSEDILNPRNLGVLRDLNKIIKIHKIRQIIFSATSLTYEQIMQMMSGVENSWVEFKMVPSNLDVVIGKSHIDKLDDYPLMEIDYSLGRKFNRFTKRVVDIGISLVLLLLLAPLALFSYLFSRRKLIPKIIDLSNNEKIRLYSLLPPKKFSFFLIWHQLLSVLRGKLTLVGAPLDYYQMSSPFHQYFYKVGLTGLVQINEKNISSPEDAEKIPSLLFKKSIASA